ncbi:MAG: DUF5662 family protein [Anaeroplasma sp.]
MHIIKHFITITKHRHKVIKYCFKAGLYRQGLAHDLSKYGLTEFINGAKFYQGTRSPHHQERIEKGHSDAWMHHKGRNKHHVEYWIDFNLELNKYSSVDMPNKYLAESICDRISASKNYQKKNFVPQMVLDYFLSEGYKIPMHDNTRKRMEYLLKYYVKYGEKAIFLFMKKYMRNNGVTFPMEEIL